MTTDLHAHDLLAAVGRLDHAAGRLFGIQTRQHAGGTVTAPSVWQQLQDERFAHGGKERTTSVPGSIPAARLDLMDLTTEIETAIRAWADDPTGDPAALVEWMASTSVWRPQDAGHVLALAAQISAWADRARDILHGGSRLEVRAACPACGRRHWYDADGLGGHKRLPALTVTTTQARCACCGTTWAPAQYGLLIQVLEQEDDSGKTTLTPPAGEPDHRR